MWYKSCYETKSKTFPGLFVFGGRSSTFKCYYWTIKDNKFVNEPLWSDSYNVDINEQEYTEQSDNKKLIADAEKIIYANDDIEFFEIDEVNIQNI